VTARKTIRRVNFGELPKSDETKTIRKIASRAGVSFAVAAAAYSANGGNYVRALAAAKKLRKNPVKSGAQFRLAEAVAHGKARATSMSKKVAKELLKKTPKALRSKFAKSNPHRKRTKKKLLNRKNPAAKRNPEASARAAYRDFHGKDPETVITVDTPRHYHGVLPGIGKLDFVSLYRPQGRAKGIKFSKGTYLCENEKRTQLFIVGGNQSVNLKDFGITHPHETEVLGEVSEIGYRTEKLHLIEKDGGKGLYVHKFSVPRPTLVYDVRNKLLSFAGGGYTIPSEGIDG
jgi:hypothetical protein